MINFNKLENQVFRIQGQVPDYKFENNTLYYRSPEDPNIWIESNKRYDFENEASFRIEKYIGEEYTYHYEISARSLGSYTSSITFDHKPEEEEILKAITEKEEVDIHISKEHL